LEYTPLDSATKRDCHKIWEFVIKEESRLRELGYEAITIGPHNFDQLLSMALVNKAFKCLVVLMEFYDANLRALDVPIDLVTLFAKALTVYRAPPVILAKLFKFLQPREGQELAAGAVRALIVAFCASKVTLIDVMPEIVEVEPHGKKKRRYQDMGSDEQDLHAQDD